MPKVGMEPVRRRQLIDATIATVAELGLHATTINVISKNAGMSSGIISHYFGGKQQLIEATVRHLLDELKIALLNNVNHSELSPRDRLMAIVDSNFSPFQRGNDATKTWLSFWAQSMHEPELARLQKVNNQRLYSNLKYSLNAIMPPEKAKDTAHYCAALIDGFWLRCVLSNGAAEDFERVAYYCKRYIDDMIELHGI